MQKDEFYKYVEHPELLDKESIALLTELVNAFPYFQTARLLLTKALHEQKNFYFDSQLKITASYFSDRKRLHQFINGAASRDNGIEEMAENAPAIHDKIADESPKEVVEPILENKDLIYKEWKEVVVLEKVLEEQEEQVAEIVVEEVIPVVEIPVIEAPIEVEKEVDLDAKHSFGEWLKELNKGGNIPEKEEIKDRDVKKEEIFEVQKKEVQEGIIDTFINTNPSLPKPKKEFYSPVNMAKLSIMENDDLCSETLAKIYFDQGNFARAKTMYERLSLKIPNKSVYFAARIKEINDLINK